MKSGTMDQQLRKPLSNDKGAGMKRMLHTGRKFMQNTGWSTIEQVSALE